MEALHKNFENKLSDLVSSRAKKLQTTANLYNYCDKLSQRINTLTEQMCVFLGFNLEAIKNINTEIVQLVSVLKIIVDKAGNSSDELDTAFLIYIPLAEKRVIAIAELYRQYHRKFGFDDLLKFLIEKFGINFIPYVDFTHRTILTERDTECVICFEAFNYSETVATVFGTECKCTQLFYHQKCFEESLDKGFHACMTCKVKFTKNNLMLVKVRPEEVIKKLKI